VDPTLPPDQWPLEALAGKMRQYCYLLEDVTADVLEAESRGDFEALRAYLRRRGVDAYHQKVEMVEGVEKGLMQVCHRARNQALCLRKASRAVRR
jgi:preprotein translocase subunit SecA